MIIFDCNGVLFDSEPIAARVLSNALKRVGLAVSAETIMRRFHSLRPADVLAAVEAAAGRKLPPRFAIDVAAETLQRLRAELRSIQHAAHALTWICGPKAVASSSSFDRIRLSLEVTGLIRFFEPRLFSAGEMRKPSPEPFLAAAARCHLAPSDCIVVEDSAAGVCGAVAAGMTPLGFVGGSHTPGRLALDLLAAGAHTIIADMRALKSDITDLRGW